uniref:Uncharacterized protein n=1 Tax=Timema monikensis TaxID=170555 RepID=A0A7R9EFN7_9NEOP|nr:unnamed protein product [Timema monikensis]
MRSVVSTAGGQLEPRQTTYPGCIKIYIRILALTESIPDRDSNLVHPVISSLDYCENSALDHAVTEFSTLDDSKFGFTVESPQPSPKTATSLQRSNHESPDGKRKTPPLPKKLSMKARMTERMVHPPKVQMKIKRAHLALPMVDHLNL